jgi:hypothetical protein
LKVAPAGSEVAERVMVLLRLISVAVMVKLIHVPAVTVWFLGVVSVSGGLVKTVTF